MTRAWLSGVLEKNPSLSISVQAGAGESPCNASSSGEAVSFETDMPVKKPKYRNNKVYVYDDETISINAKDERKVVKAAFDSEKEYRRWNELRLLEQAGVVTELTRQAPFEIQRACDRHGEHIRAVYYKADFTYRTPDGTLVVEDVKGQDSKTGEYICTKDFKLKWKLLKYKYSDIKFRIY